MKLPVLSIASVFAFSLLLNLSLSTSSFAQRGGGGGGGQGGGGQQNQSQNNNPTMTESDDNEETGLRHLWIARMHGGNYQVLINKIASISKHEYISDGVARVVEVTIATDSSVAARFYYLEPADLAGPLSIAQNAQSRMREIAEKGIGKAGQTENMATVKKSYPTTTHAHTVEYQLVSEDALESLYRNLSRTMESGRGRVFNEPSE